MPKRFRSISLLLAAFALGCSDSQKAAESALLAQPANHVLASSSPDAAAPSTQPAIVASASDDARDAAPTVSAGIEQTIEDKARSNPRNLVPQLDLQLLHLIQDKPIERADTLPPDERQLLSTLTNALADFRRGAAEKSRLETKVEPLKDLSDKLKAAEPMSIPTLALCRSVTQFGIYDSFDPPRFIAGQETQVIIYCELDNFFSTSSSDGRWETRLSYEAILYTDGDAGVSVINKKPTNIVDRCRNKRRDFFLADRMTIPATLPVGRYLLKVTVIDRAANHVAEKTLPILVAPS